MKTPMKQEEIVERNRLRKRERIEWFKKLAASDKDPRTWALEIIAAGNNHAVYLDGNGTHTEQCVGCLALAALGREE